MTDKTNDEKLKILRDRLAQIQDKSTNENSLSDRKDLNLEKDINNSIENSVEITKNKKNNKTVIYIILFFLIGLSTFFYFLENKTADIIEKTDFVMQNTFWIGLYPGLGEEELSFVVKTLKNILRK